LPLIPRYPRKDAFLDKAYFSVGQSDAMRGILAQVEQVARTDSTVLIAGETGTGKEVIARAIHNLSKRKERALVTVNCAALPPSLIESELFGREKGAYPGAMTMMRGRFEVADGSTLFLDEIGEMPLDVQAKLLRVHEHAMIVSNGKSLGVRIPAIPSEEPATSPALEDVERRHILSVLEKTVWRVTGPGGAAERLGLKRTTLQSRMKKLGIKRPAS
jgi:transcriptional regulator with GAF, ATPase, and Fis domain